MEITAKELRGKPGQIIEQASRGSEVVITMRGKKMAKLIPYKKERNNSAHTQNDDEIFGMWENRDDMNSVDDYVRSIRKGRLS